MRMHELLRSLSARRPLFHSEADFQHALAWEVQLANKSAAVRLEQQVAADGKRVHLDLLVRDNGLHTAIELKYKTKRAALTHAGEEFHLRNQSAQDIGRYDFLKDIVRIERYVAAHPGSEGYALLLTNDQTYWQESKKAHAVDTAFRIHHGRTLTGELAWGAAASDGTKKSRTSDICLAGTYALAWHDFSTVEKQLFRYVLVHIPRVA